VAHRDANGAFPSRKALKKVPRSATRPSSRRRLPAHHERRQPARRLGGAPGSLSGGRTHPADVQEEGARTDRRRGDLQGADAKSDFTDERFGLPTVQDILRELEKPGRDPRPEFKTATFRDGVET
jgi:uncharacterized protein